MDRSFRRSRGRSRLAAIVALVLAASAWAIPIRVAAADPTNMVLVWNANAITVLGTSTTATPPGLGQGPPISPIHLAMVHGAIYDAVNTIDPRYEPYLGGLTAPTGPASQAAAVAQAAHDVLVGLVPTTHPSRTQVLAWIDSLLATSLAATDDGTAEDAGVAIGRAAAAAMLLERTGDGRFGSKAFTPGTAPGEWRPVPTGNVGPTANVFAWAGDVEPFTMKSTDQFRTEGPLDLTSPQYAKEFDEVKAKGAATGSTRTEEEDLLASFVSANPVPFMNTGLRGLVGGWSTSEQARFFAMTSMASADALIGCFDDKDYWSFWRPQTAIQEAANDGNPATAPDPAWTARYPNPGYPDHPSGYNCYTAAMMHTARLAFGTDKVTFTLTSPGTAPLSNLQRTYHRFTDVIDDTIDGRILTGFHFRTPDVQGAWLGKKVAQWVDKHYFEPLD